MRNSSCFFLKFVHHAGAGFIFACAVPARRVSIMGFHGRFPGGLSGGSAKEHEYIDNAGAAVEIFEGLADGGAGGGVVGTHGVARRGGGGQQVALADRHRFRRSPCSVPAPPGQPGTRPGAGWCRAGGIGAEQQTGVGGHDAQHQRVTALAAAHDARSIVRIEADHVAGLQRSRGCRSFRPSHGCPSARHVSTRWCPRPPRPRCGCRPPSRR
jgi:hypothetical protein